jgi:hypothetical protein
MAYAWAGYIYEVQQDSSGVLHIIFDNSAPVEGLVPSEEAHAFRFTQGQTVTLLGELSVRDSDGRVILTAGYWMLNPVSE